MIRKTSLAEARTVLGKQKARFVSRGHFIAEILWKTASPYKISLKTGNQLFSYSQKLF